MGTDSLFSAGDNNWLFAGKGDDIVRAPGFSNQGGTDTMFGDIGNDVLSGGDGNDLIFGNNDQDEISGGRGNDTLYGGQGNDNIDASDGNDLMFGDLGNDTMRGGNGNDQFVIGFGTDIILDYGRGTDSILLQGNITEADLEFERVEINVGSSFQNNISINLRSTGETIAILADISLEEFNRIKIIQPLII